MKRIHLVVIILCRLLLSNIALAEHQTLLRGLVNLPGNQFALLEIQHTLARRADGSPVIVTLSRFVKTGEQFEDSMVKGAHFPVEVLEIDFAKETVKTREADVEHIYSLPNPKSSNNNQRLVPFSRRFLQRFH